jgi:hypothetical protein
MNDEAVNLTPEGGTGREPSKQPGGQLEAFPGMPSGRAAKFRRGRVETALADCSPDWSAGPAQLLTLAVTEVFGRLVAVDPKFLDLVAEHNRLAYERRDRKARKRAGGKGRKKARKPEEE